MKYLKVVIVLALIVIAYFIGKNQCANERYVSADPRNLTSWGDKFQITKEINDGPIERFLVPSTDLPNNLMYMHTFGESRKNLREP